MGRKIFVSYKYADSSVKQLSPSWLKITTVRDYVDLLEEKLDRTSNIYKGESDGEDLSYLSEYTIEKKLKDRIWDSTVTIVFISPNMKESYKLEKNQWIPREISYSLRKVTRGGKTSQSNSLIAVVLPDSNGFYNYANYSTYHFKIIQKNIDCGYAVKVNWNDFINNISYYISKADRSKEFYESIKVVNID